EPSAAEVVLEDVALNQRHVRKPACSDEVLRVGRVAIDSVDLLEASRQAGKKDPAAGAEVEAARAVDRVALEQAVDHHQGPREGFAQKRIAVGVELGVLGRSDGEGTKLLGRDLDEGGHASRRLSRATRQSVNTRERGGSRSACGPSDCSWALTCVIEVRYQA